jgi:hypothetical protein
VCATEAAHTKKHTPIVVTQNLTSTKKTLPVCQVKFAFLPNLLSETENTLTKRASKLLVI